MTDSKKSLPLAEFGLQVSETRTRKHLSVAQVAAGARVSRKQLTRLEQGENVSAVFIQKVARYLDIKAVSLGGGIVGFIGTGDADVHDLLKIADDVIADAAEIAERIRMHAVNASLPQSERSNDATAIDDLVARGSRVGGHDGRRLGRAIEATLTRDAAQLPRRQKVAPPKDDMQLASSRKKGV